MDTHTISRQRLTIRIGRNSLSFSTVVTDDNGSGRVVFEPYTVRSGISMAANLREALKTASLLASDYQRTYVMVDTPPLLIPTELYSEEEMPTLYAHAFPSNDKRAILPCVLPTLNAVAAFSMSKDLKLVVDDNFRNATFGCVGASVWRHLYQRSFTGQRNKLYGYFHDKRLDVFSFAQNHFKFFNSFDTSLSHDAVYFLLYVWKQLRMDGSNDELHIAGEVPERDVVLAELRRYVQRVYVINPAGDFNRAPITQIKGMTYDLMTYYLK